MQEYVIELSKYFIAFFMVLYTASCFYTFRYPVGEKHRGVFILQDLFDVSGAGPLFSEPVSCQRRFSVFCFSLHLY